MSVTNNKHWSWVFFFLTTSTATKGGQKFRHNSKKAKGSRIHEQAGQLGGKNLVTAAQILSCPQTWTRSSQNEVVNRANDPSTI